MIATIEEKDCLLTEDFIKVAVQSSISIPFFNSYVAAGFPSPAENFIERECDLNELCITNQEATYFVRVGSDSMSGDGISPSDILVVDCSREPTEGRIVVVWLNGDHAVKRIHYTGEMVVLLSSNSKYLPIYVHPHDAFKVFGVVTNVIKRFC